MHVQSLRSTHPHVRLVYEYMYTQISFNVICDWRLFILLNNGRSMWAGVLPMSLDTRYLFIMTKVVME